MVRILPVDVLGDEAQVHQKLVQHTAVEQEDQVEHEAQGGGGNDDGNVDYGSAIAMLIVVLGVVLSNVANRVFKPRNDS